MNRDGAGLAVGGQMQGDALVVGDTFGLFASPLKDEAWTLLQIGLGGYVVGRSGEKIAKVLQQ